MFDTIVTLYCITDDLLKAIGHRDDCRRELTDAEVLTTAFAAVLYFPYGTPSGITNHQR